MDLKGTLSSYAKLTEEGIARYTGREPDYLYEPLRDLFSRGGKRLRPTLCMLACEAVGGKATDALKAGAVIEMVHNFTLIHDDIADKSELRRGKPCLHHKYGLGIAINSGDGLFSVAYEALSDALEKTDERKARRVFRTLSAQITRVCEGQSLDIGWVRDKRWDLSEKDYFDMIRRKTGALMAASCEVGAIIGGGSEKEVNALREFGMNMGVGFQIHDDVLNLRADVGKYGKEIGGDIHEGKRTLMVIYTLAACKPEERDRLIRILDKGTDSRGEIDDAVGIIEKYGSIDKAAAVARDMIESGKGELKALKGSKAKEALLGIADYMVERDL